MRLDSIAYRRHWVKYYSLMIGVTVASVTIGLYLERLEGERMSRFRDKSALYGRKLAPGEPPSWP